MAAFRALERVTWARFGSGKMVRDRIGRLTGEQEKILQAGRGFSIRPDTERLARLVRGVGEVVRAYAVARRGEVAVERPGPPQWAHLPVRGRFSQHGPQAYDWTEQPAMAS